jgi:hypothetical protein
MQPKEKRGWNAPLDCASNPTFAVGLKSAHVMHDRWQQSNDAISERFYS